MSHKLGLEQHFTLHEEHRPFSIPRRKPGQTVRCQSMEASTLAMHLPDVPLQDYHAPKFERDTRTRVWLIIDLNHRIGLRQPCLSSPQRLRPGLVRCWAAVLHRAEYGMNSWDLTQQLRMRGQSSACANKQPEGSENEEKRSLFFLGKASLSRTPVYGPPMFLCACHVGNMDSEITMAHHGTSNGTELDYLHRSIYIGARQPLPRECKQRPKLDRRRSTRLTTQVSLSHFRERLRDLN